MATVNAWHSQLVSMTSLQQNMRHSRSLVVSSTLFGSISTGRLGDRKLPSELEPIVDGALIRLHTAAGRQFVVKSTAAMSKGLLGDAYAGGSCSSRSWGTISYSRSNAAIDRRAKAEHAFVDVQVDDDEAESLSGSGGNEIEDYGEVDVILASRVTEERKTEYLILWKDDHPDSWEPAENIARDLVGGYETPWWQAARKADAEKLKELLDSEDVQRDVNAIDENERTALHFSAGLGSEKCSRLLAEYGADVHWQDKDGYTALHLASGYVHINTVKALVELGADPDLEDGKGRSALLLAQELLAKTPRTNPLQFARRMAMDQVVKALDEVMYENVEVEQILDKRIAENGGTEYLVKWSDGSDNGWVSVRDIGEDLVKDYEEGLEYGVVEQVLDKREIDGKEEYYVMWSDGKETWETVENIGEEIVADFNGSRKPSAQEQRLAEVNSTNGRSTETGECLT